MPVYSVLIFPKNFTIFFLQAIERFATIILYDLLFRLMLLVSYIFSAKKLDQRAVTLSLKGGCFQAYLMIVFA